MKMDFTFEPTHTNKINTKIQTQRAIQIARYGWRESEREKCENVTKRDTFFGRFGICEMSQSVKIDLSFWLICKWQRKPYRKSNLPWIRTNREEKNGNQRWWSGLAFDASAPANFQSQFHIATVILYTARVYSFLLVAFFRHTSLHPSVHRSYALVNFSFTFYAIESYLHWICYNILFHFYVDSFFIRALVCATVDAKKCYGSRWGSKKPCRHRNKTRSGDKQPYNSKTDIAVERFCTRDDVRKSMRSDFV